MKLDIFCDEAGYTGNNLLDSQQDVFVYSSISIDPSRAKEIVQRTIKDFRIQGNELKGSRLIKSNNGRRAISYLFTKCAKDVRLVVHLKTYALASKLFEYIFEPTISDQNSMFYAIDFHRYVSTLLYMYFRVQNKSAEALFADFMQFVNGGNTSALEAMFPANGVAVDYHSDPLVAVGLYAMLHRQTIAEEVLRFSDDLSIPNWILDLT